jgi:hypothetical protein
MVSRARRVIPDRADNAIATAGAFGQLKAQPAFGLPAIMRVA